jgi:signal transduction histidine kinase
MDSEERARRNLATILHDDLQQILAAAMMQIPAQENKISSTHISALLKEAVAVSRSMVSELSPIPLRDSTLPEALQWLADWFAEHHKHQIKVEVAADFPSLSDGSNRFVFDTVRELLFNSVKHAGVGKATVRLLGSAGNALQVEVADNGHGFDPACIVDKGRANGFGLYSIRERLIALGGGMEIHSAPRQGARFAITLPFTGGGVD